MDNEPEENPIQETTPCTDDLDVEEVESIPSEDEDEDEDDIDKMLSELQGFQEVRDHSDIKTSKKTVPTEKSFRDIWWIPYYCT